MGIGLINSGCRWKLDESEAKRELELALNDTNVNKFEKLDSIPIKDKKHAISIAEPILFKIYGKDLIISERPYVAYYIDKYWIISGTLPKNYIGGTFVIILDSRDSKIMRITHYK